VASVPGGIGLPQLVHITKVIVAAFSAIMTPQMTVLNWQTCLYFLCLVFASLLLEPKPIFSWDYFGRQPS
jgi:hypothetical protein